MFRTGSTGWGARRARARNWQIAAALLLIAALTALVCTPAHAQVYNKFGPATGILKGAVSTYQTSAATSTDVIGLFSACSGTQYLGADGACHNGFVAPLTTKGDIFTFDTANQRLPVGTDGQVLSAASSQATGLQWVAGSPLTTKGDLFTFSTVNARLAKGTDGYVLTADSTQTTGLSWTPNGTFVPVPASVPDLALWFKADGLVATNGQVLQNLRSGQGGALAGWPVTTPTGSWTVSSALLNGLTTIDVVSGAGNGQEALLNNIMYLGSSNGVTFFLVFKQTSGAGTEAMVGGATHNVGFYTSSANNKITLVDSGNAVLVSATSAWTNATWTQVNCTYKASTGAYAFRQARATNGSGTTGTIATNGKTDEIFSDAGGSNAYIGSVAELIIYSRVLSGSEITSVENYLFSKWGV